MATRRRLFDLLLRPAELVSEATRRNPADDAALLQAATRARDQTREAVALLEPLVGKVERGRVAADALGEQVRALAARDHELRTILSRARDLAARVSILALNAGLEGARIEGPAGRAITAFSEQTRELVQRGEQTLTEALGLSEKVTDDLGKLDLGAAELQRTSQGIGEDTRAALDAAHRADQAHADLRERLESTTGVDPELAKAIETAQHHARELAAALSAVSGRGGLAASAIRPILEPVLRLFEPVDGAATDELEG